MTSSDGVDSIQIEMVGVIDDEQLSAFEADLGLTDVNVETPPDDGLESIDPVTAISVAISSVEMARRVWQWWKSRGEETVPEITAKLPGGAEVRFSGSDEQELERFLAYLADRSKPEPNP